MLSHSASPCARTEAAHEEARQLELCGPILSIDTQGYAETREVPTICRGAQLHSYSSTMQEESGHDTDLQSDAEKRREVPRARAWVVG